MTTAMGMAMAMAMTTTMMMMTMTMMMMTQFLPLDLTPAAEYGGFRQSGTHALYPYVVIRSDGRLDFTGISETLNPLKP